MKRVLDYLSRHQKRFVRELCDYVAFPSVSAQPRHRGDLNACARWLKDHCRRLGLEAELNPTAGNPVVVARTPRSRQRAKAKPHYLVYGHYDVQPPEPFDLWKSPPFEPRIQGRSLFGRGSSDNKGQHFAHLKAVEAFLHTGTDLPCDLTFVIEGEEEVGSESLAGFLRQNRSRLKCDGVVVSDNALPRPETPALTYALRGILAVEIELTGPSRDLHSGIYGGAVDNPALVLCQMLARLRDQNGRVTIPGFYDEVRSLSRYERGHLAKGEPSDAALRKFFGVPGLFGEKGFNSLERRTARPTLEINGLTSGYQGEGSKTIIPAKAGAKLTFRLVPDQTPPVMRKRIVRHLKKICPPTVRLRVQAGHAGEPYLVSPKSPQARAALRALKRAFGHEPALKREGGSIPIVNDFKKQLGVDTLLLGLALPDDNAHSPNEKFDLDCFADGMRLSACLWEELGALNP
jgi:acetylornithine deacetylase/succinyl-diaminopimelate desuccinylase-like protein